MECECEGEGEGSEEEGGIEENKAEPEGEAVKEEDESDEAVLARVQSVVAEGEA